MEKEKTSQKQKVLSAFFLTVFNIGMFFATKSFVVIYGIPGFFEMLFVWFIGNVFIIAIIYNKI